MEISLNKKTTTEGIIKIKLTEDDYQPHVEEKVRDYSRRASIKGFRAGKVPTALIKKMYGKSILVEEINHVISHKLDDYIKENKIKILGEPIPNPERQQDIDWDNQRDFEFEYAIGMVEDFSYDISPAVTLPVYKIEVSPTVVEETIHDLRLRFGSDAPVEVSSPEDEIIGTLTSADGNTSKEIRIPVSKLSTDMQQSFVGRKKDDMLPLDISTFSTEDVGWLNLTAEEQQAFTGDSRFTITSITHRTPAETNVEFFEQVFGKDSVADMQAFQDKIRESIQQNYDRETQYFSDHQIEDYLLANTSINLPESFLKSWLMSSTRGQVTEEILDKEFDQYKRTLKWDLIKNKVAEENNITVEAEEVKQRAKELIATQFGGAHVAAALGDRLDAIADNYLQQENGQHFMRLYNQLKAEKILGFIKEKISFTEKTISLDEFKQMLNTHHH